MQQNGSMNRNSTKPFWISTRIGRWYPRQWKKNWGTVTLSAVGMFGEGAGWGVPPDLDRRKNRDSKRRRQLEPATP